MHVFFEKIRTQIAAVTVKNAKVAAFGPFAFVVWLSDVHDYGNSILIVVFDHAVEGIDSIALHQTISFMHELDRFEFRDADCLFAGQHYEN